MDGAIRGRVGVHRESYLLLLLLLPILIQLDHGSSQQPYMNNDQLDCYVNHTNTLGYSCNGPPSCTSYFTFRTTSTYSTVPSIATLLSADDSSIAAANSVTNVASFPENHLLFIPVNCSCATRHKYYEHNTTYTLKNELETYMTVANDTLQGLTTCQSMMTDNPAHDSYNLMAGDELVAPLFCACPSTNQTNKGFNYIVSYLTDYDDDVTTVAALFGVDEQRIYEANQLDTSSTIYPFNPMLVPLETIPTKINLNASPAPPPPPPPPSSSSSIVSGSSNKWVFLGTGIAIGVAIMVVPVLFLLILVLRSRKRRQQQPRKGFPPPNDEESRSGGDDKALRSLSQYCSVSTDGVKYAIGSLTVYKFESIRKATGDFRESNRIKGSVFRADFHGDHAAVKVLNGDVSNEINILKQINHTHIIRLSGFCIHDGNTYLVYEFAEKGSLRELLVEASLGWKQRVQIAYGIADGLNYLHNYCNPPYVHKNLSSSNVLLDGNLRAKITSFGLARTLTEEDEDSGGMHLTRHVVGTKGFLAPEYIENGLVTLKMDVYAFGMVVLELLSGRMAVDEEVLIAASITEVLQGDDAREKLRCFMDDGLMNRYPFDMAYLMAQLAKMCVAPDLNSRPSISELLVQLSKIHTSSLLWDCSDELDHSSSLTQAS